MAAVWLLVALMVFALWGMYRLHAQLHQAINLLASQKIHVRGAKEEHWAQPFASAEARKELLGEMGMENGPL